MSSDTTSSATPSPAQSQETAPQSARKLIARVLISLVLIAAIVMGARKGFDKLRTMRKPATRAATDVPPILVRGMTTERADYTELLRGYGVARAPRSSQAVALMDGRVTFVEDALDIGDAVKATGASNGSSRGLPVLVRLDGRDIADRSARAQAEQNTISLEIGRLASQRTNLTARMGLARDELATAQREFKRIQSLVPQTLTPSELDRQRLQVSLQERRTQELTGQLDDNTRQAEGARARIVVAQKSIELEQRQSEYTTVYAPSEGRVTRRAVELSDWVRRGDVLFELVDLSRVEVPIALSASRYADVHKGTTVRLLDPSSNDELLETVVARKSANIDTASRTFYAFVEVTGTPHSNSVPPGRHVRGEVSGRVHPQVIAVPREAFLDGKLFVAVDRPVDESNEDSSNEDKSQEDKSQEDRVKSADYILYTVEERTPTVVRWLPGVALVSKGLESGERLLLTNLESIGDGGVIRVTLGDTSASED